MDDISTTTSITTTHGASKKCSSFLSKMRTATKAYALVEGEEQRFTFTDRINGRSQYDGSTRMYCGPDLGPTVQSNPKWVPS